MKKNIFIMIFASVISILSISNVKADTVINGILVSDDFYFPLYQDIVCPPSSDNCSDTLLGKISSSYNSDYHLQCWYSTTKWSGSNIQNNNIHSEIYCYVGGVGFVPYLHWQNGQGINQYNPDGFIIDGYPWINSSNKNSYQSLAIYRWNYETYTWDTICANWSNSCIYNVIGANQYPIVNYSSVSGDTSTPIFKTDIWYTSDRWNAPLFQGNLKPRPDSQIELSFIQTDTNLNITFNDSDDECSGNCVIKYGYNQNDLDNIVDDTPPVKRFNFNIEVLKNGNLYFDVIKDDVVLRSFVYNVIGLVTINGYDYYNIPAGNYQIYLSNLGNSTSGFIYLGKDIDGISNNFSFLDSNGNLLGTQSINYVNPDIIEVDSISGENYDFTSRIKYDFSNYSATKVISFNHNSNKRLQLFIPSGMYLDYVNIDERENFDCSSDSNINNSIDYNNCYVSFDISDNGNISTVDDNNLSYHTVQDNSNISGFGSKFKNMFISFTTPFYIIGNIYNVFISNLPVPVMYAIYIGFGLVVFCIFMKIWL